MAPTIDSLIQQAALFRQNQQMEEALDLIGQAVRQAPADPRAAIGFAQLSFECWRPAADLFAAARRLIPDQPDIIRNHAMALAAEGDFANATALLEGFVAHNPLWLDGHRALASLLTTHGHEDRADASYVIACGQLPDNIGLRLAWFQHHAMARNWECAGEILDGFSEQAAQNDNVRMARLYWRSESGDPGLHITDFAPLADRNDPGFDLCQIRFLLRSGMPERAAEIATKHIGGAQERSFWPYLSLCWRLLNDPRAAWLDGEPLLIDQLDLHYSVDQLSDLAMALRKLHRLSAPYSEQSVRGGTQTDRQLFFNPDPDIQRLRKAVIGALGRFAEQLPAVDEGHPLLECNRDRIAFEGSWSARLSGGGHHASHTHVRGWISAVFYVEVPENLGPAPSGYLTLGAPPPELQLGLEPYCHIEPKPGRLAIFPSTMWHATVPYPEGERLTVAFDLSRFA